MSNIFQPEQHNETVQSEQDGVAESFEQDNIINLLPALPDVAEQETFVYRSVIANVSTQKELAIEDVAMQETLVLQTAPPPTPPAKRSMKKRRRRWIITCICLVLVLLPLGISSFTLYIKYTAQYHNDLALAQGGVKHLQNAEKLLKSVTQGSLNTTTVTQAHQEFSNASTDFTQLKSDLDQLPGVATDVPKYGHLLGSALKIVPLAIELSQAGMIGSDAFTIVLPHLHGILDTRQPGITLHDLAALTQDVNQIQVLLTTATTQINQLQPADFQIDPRIGPALTTFRTDLPKIQSGIQTAQMLLTVAPTLLGVGQPTSYLIEQLDSTELRPGGGFIGSYGTATFSDGHLAGLHMTDTYILDDDFTYKGHSIPFPQAYSWFHLASSWSLRDSNLDADFPTAARYAEQIYQTEGGTVPVQGVIAITPQFIENALTLTGPIAVPEYGETITSQNLVDRIHYHQLKEELAAGDNPSPDGHSSGRKRFTELLFEHFFARIEQILPTSIGKFASLMFSSLHAKDIQIYLNSTQAEDLLQQNHFASTIQDPASDSFFVVDANIISNKANYFMTYTLHDQVTIDASGDATHHATLTYNWPQSANSQQNNYGGITNAYSDYVRIYVPPDSTLQTQNGWNAQGTSQAFGRKVLAGVFHLQYGHSGTITLTWTVPHAAVHNAQGWYYHYLLQRQAGIVWNVNLQVALPACAHFLRTTGSLKPNTAGVIAQSLTADSDLGVDYTCS